MHPGGSIHGLPGGEPGTGRHRQCVTLAQLVARAREAESTGRRDAPTSVDDDGDTLTRAFSIQHRAGLLGFDWDDPRDALDKVREETAEVAALLGRGPGDAIRAELDEEPVEATRSKLEAAADEATRSRLEEELGDLLFAVVNVARLAGVDPEAALEGATRKFAERFREVRRLAGKRGLPMPGTPLEPLDRLWDEVKGAAG